MPDYGVGYVAPKGKQIPKGGREATVLEPLLTLETRAFSPLGALMAPRMDADELYRHGARLEAQLFLARQHIQNLENEVSRLRGLLKEADLGEAEVGGEVVVVREWEDEKH